MLTIEEAKLRLLECYDFAAAAKRSKRTKKYLREHAELALDAAIKDIDGKVGEVIRFSFPFAAIAKRAPIIEGPLADNYAGKICVRLDLLYAPCDKTHYHIATIEEADK